VLCAVRPVPGQGSRLSAEQLCEVLPLVQEAELAVPVEWLEAALGKIQVGALQVEACVCNLGV
jgi:hypothetical protein